MARRRILYIQKGGGLKQAGRIGRVTFSKSGRTRQPHMVPRSGKLYGERQGRWMIGEAE